MNRFSVVDLETTGLNPKKDEVLSIAIIPMVGTKILIGEHFYTFVKPKNLKGESIKYHGIDFKVLNSAPTFSEIAERLKAMLEGTILVGYATSFDARILENHFRKCKIKIKFKTIDIAKVESLLMRREGYGVIRFSFDDLLERYGLEGIYRHSALADAYYTAVIFQHQLKKAEKFGIGLNDLIEASMY
jgi:DNA polymerase-3 subunit epsilon